MNRSPSTTPDLACKVCGYSRAVITADRHVVCSDCGALITGARRETTLADLADLIDPDSVPTAATVGPAAAAYLHYLLGRHRDCTRGGRGRRIG